MEYKTYFLKISGLAFLFFSLLTFLLSSFYPQAAMAANPPLSNSGGGSWTQKYGIGIGNSTASVLSGYQFRVNLSTAVFGNPYTNIKADGSDIRFTNSAGAELSYWIEKGSWNNTGNSIVWVKIDSIAASPNITTIYMYYGNSLATSSSNAQNTFDFFDDFDGAVLDAAKWNPAPDILNTCGTPTINSTLLGSVLKITTTSSNSDPCGQHEVIKTLSSFSVNHAIRAKEKDNSGSWYPGTFGFGLHLPLPQNGVMKGICTNHQYCLITVKDSNIFSSATKITDNLWYIFDLLWTDSLATLTRNDVVLGTNSDTNKIPTSSLPVTMGNVGDMGGGASNTEINMDWIAVRQFINPEPAIVPSSCTLSSDADNNAVLKGEKVKLSWITVNVTNPTINNGIGLVSPAESGSITVGPINSSVTYTMTATSSSGPTTCSLPIGVIIPPTGGLVPCARLADNLATNEIDESKPCTLCAMFYMLKNIINFAMTLAIGIGVFILVIAGLLYATSAGNTGKIELAKSAITSAIIGIAIVFIAWMVIAVILQGMGYANMTTWNQVNCIL
ncbi:MAG: DUF2341 domain-containing protein [bacterium]|nr:DUF2341 domain-containing protein [bacterium]